MLPTINEILQLRPKPESYRAKKHDDMISSGTAVQEKLDGWRFTVMRFEDDDVQVVGRKAYINYWDFLKYDTVLAERILDLPPNTVLDGEYHGGEGVTGTDVPTLMRACSGDFTPWAIPWLAGECLMSRSLPHANSVLLDLGWDPPSICPMKGWTVESLMHEAEKQGLEGYVLKTSQWNLGSWIKVKPTRTFDLVVTSVVAGKSRNEGRIGSLCVSAQSNNTTGVYRTEVTAEEMNGESFDVMPKIGNDLTEVGRVGGLSDELRETEPNDLMGRVVEVRAQDVTRDGRLKFARLVRFRDDKDVTMINSIGDLHG